MYPEPGLITYPGELELFWAQHLLTGVICPIILVACGRYNQGYKPDLLNIIYVFDMQGYHSFTWFCRIVQGPVSVLTWANVNFQLCFPDDQDLYLMLGKYYLPVAELCVLLLSIAYVKSIFLVCWIKEWAVGGVKYKSSQLRGCLRFGLIGNLELDENFEMILLLMDDLVGLGWVDINALDNKAFIGYCEVIF